MDIKLNVESLRYVQVICETGSFTAAAKVLGVSQPALSKVIRRLEQSYGQQLFDRSTKGVIPTEFTDSILPHVNAIINHADKITALAMDKKENSQIRIGISPLINPALVSKVYQAMRRINHDDKTMQVIVIEENLAELQEKLQQDQLDLMLVPSVGPTPGCQRKIIDWEPLYVVDYSTENSSRIDATKLSDQPLLLVPDACGLTRYTRDIVHDLGVDVDEYPGEAMSYSILEQWAEMGLGQAILPESKLHDSPDKYSLLCDGSTVIEIFYEAAWNPKNPLAGVIDKLVEIVVADRDHARV